MYSEMIDGLPTVVYSNDPYEIILGGVDMAPNFNKNI
jgi:hypothetical protein